MHLKQDIHRNITRKTIEAILAIHLQFTLWKVDKHIEVHRHLLHYMCTIGIEHCANI